MLPPLHSSTVGSTQHRRRACRDTQLSPSDYAGSPICSAAAPAPCGIAQRRQQRQPVPRPAAHPACAATEITVNGACTAYQPTAYSTLQLPYAPTAAARVAVAGTTPHVHCDAATTPGQPAVALRMDGSASPLAAGAIQLCEATSVQHSQPTTELGSESNSGSGRPAAGAGAHVLSVPKKKSPECSTMPLGA